MAEPASKHVDDRVVEVARAIRSLLGDLIGTDAADCDMALQELLARNRMGIDVRFEIVALLRRWGGTRDWAAGMLNDPDGRPPHLSRPPERQFSVLPGGGEAVDLQRYACPHDGDYVWYRTSATARVPACPDHGVALIPRPLVR